MKFPAVNPDLMKVAMLVGLTLLLGSGAATLAQEANVAHEYRADGETTIETVNGLRVITLRDNVFVRQNDIELTGDQAILEYNLDNQLQTVRLTGSPASFQQTPGGESAPLTGSSETINYYAGNESVVEFIGGASFNQPGTTLQCAQIRHVIESGATSGQACSGSLSQQIN
ncbi:MAG: LptA/OstA family protein [Gammaproteobacteria bacterium]|nr:LptA/OstA family protein [Gammaproteobacteria bacterium]